MKIDYVEINKLKPDPNNARTHDEKNLKAIKGSLEKFGQVEPLVVQKNTMCVIGGNGRLEVMKSLGWENVNVVFVDISGDKAKALGLALNRTAELASWDDGILSEQLEALADVDFDITDIGFEEIVDDFDFKDPGEASDTKVEDNKIVVTCQSIDEKDRLFAELNERGFKVK